MRKRIEVASFKGRRSPWKKILLSLVLVGLLCFGALFGAVMWGSCDHISGEPGIMIVLGCQVKPWGPSILLQDRLNEALGYLEEHPDMIVVVSGGQGEDEPVSEAQAMRDYLVERGVDENRILMEDQSSNTVQNLRYSGQLLRERGYDTAQEILVVSNGFHLTRVRMLFGRVWGDTDRLSTLAAPSSHTLSRLKMYVREPLALVKSFVVDF